MVVKIVPMPPPIQITDDNLEIVETACRGPYNSECFVVIAITRHRGEHT